MIQRGTFKAKGKAEGSKLAISALESGLVIDKVVSRNTLLFRSLGLVDFSHMHTKAAFL